MTATAAPISASSPDSDAKADRWPFFRQDPDCVVLGVRPGHKPSAKLPVRIFLGTEEAQYRAERVFFHSIEKVRDPSRVYEIHLMKNLNGFDRRKWRTGFTNYRYAIPEFAGGTGRGIYNDVDQIYLADPALLFDLDMGSHGYLAISAKDTSVMLIDCERMLPMWNRRTASSMGKHALINKPAATPGLWGALDGHWNARDQEYVVGQTKCLHYTALHQQPWQPFPDLFSYHPNPLAYIWHDLEREADALGYEVFDADHPGPNFAAVLHRNTADEPSGVPVTPSAVELLSSLGATSVLCVTARDGAQTAWGALVEGREVRRASLAGGGMAGDEPVDAVLAADLLEAIPPADIPWVLGGLFAAARKLVHVRLPATEPEGLGSGEWWRKRLEEAARRHPGVSWQLDMLDRGAKVPDTLVTCQVRRVLEVGTPRVWALLDGDAEGDAQVLRLAEALGWGSESKRLHYGLAMHLPNRLRGASLRGVDVGRSSPLAAPLPDLVIAAGDRSAPVAGWLKKASGGRTRVVQLGCPHASFDLFDLIVTAPHYRLPIRDNVLHVAASLAGLSAADLAASREAWAARLASGTEPRTLLVLSPGHSPYKLTKAAARKLAVLTSKRVKETGGSLWVAVEHGVGPSAEAALTAGLTCPFERIDLDEPEAPARQGLVAAADRLILLGDDAGLLSAACLAGKPVDLFELPRWHDGIPGARRVLGLLTLLAGGGTSYRGTPHQQHLVARGLDHLMTRGVISLPRDLTRLHKGLIARGLITRLDDERMMASPKPLDDLERTVARVRRMMAERPAREEMRRAA